MKEQPAHMYAQSTLQKRVSPSHKNILLILFFLIITCCVICFFVFKFLSTAPSTRDTVQVLQIDRGMSVQQIANRAKEVGVVRSSIFLYALLTYSYDPTGIYAGTYSFTEPQSVFEVAKKLASSDVDTTLLRLTIPEGTTRKEIATIANKTIDGFDEQQFLELTKNNEGYLFPDTYFIPKDFTAEELVTLLTQTFATKVALYTKEIEDSALSLYEILTLASLLEREANSEESMKMVSGILQNRLSIGMALQADASIEYVLDKSLEELVPEDLDIDTPYNTYLNKGLPPTPIGNPGLIAIESVLHPTESPYMFYITGDDGIFYYAKTFEEHKSNVRKHLR